jgi:hypothetical protein
MQCFITIPLAGIYRVLRAQAGWTLIHTSRKDTEESTIQASITLDGVTLTDCLIRWSPNEWPSVCREIPLSAFKMFCAMNTLHKVIHTISFRVVCIIAANTDCLFIQYTVSTSRQFEYRVNLSVIREEFFVVFVILFYLAGTFTCISCSS